MCLWYTGEIMNVMRQFFKNVTRSIRDFSFYKEILGKPFFFSLQYLYLLTITVLFIQTLFFTISAAFFLPKLPQFIDSFQNRLGTVYPRNLILTIKNGRISTNTREPVIIHFPEITDSTQYNSFITIDIPASQTDYADKNTMILVTENGVVYPEANGTVPYRFESAAQFEDAVITNEVFEKAKSRLAVLLDMIPVIAPWLLIAATIFIPLFGALIVVLWRMIILIILTGILWPISMIFGNTYTYRDLYRMGMHALSVPVMLSFFLTLMGVNVPLVFASSFLLWMVIVLARLNERTARAQ